MPAHKRALASRGDAGTGHFFVLIRRLCSRRVKISSVAHAEVGRLAESRDRELLRRVDNEDRAYATSSRIDVNRTLKIAGVDVAAGGNTLVHLSAMASLRLAPRVSPTLQMRYIPRWISALAPRLNRNEAETEQFLYERTRSPSTIGIVI